MGENTNWLLSRGKAIWKQPQHKVKTVTSNLNTDLVIIPEGIQSQSQDLM